jgi:hypothetical protein
MGSARRRRSTTPCRAGGRAGVRCRGATGGPRVETTPEPTGETDVDRSVAWSAGTDLSGFEVTMTVDSAGDNQSANDGTGADSSEGSTPGFTALTGLLAVVVAASVVVFRKRAD